jgi:predicted dehydrogenase
VAHYRRGQPFFNKIKELLDQKIIGDIRFARLALYKKSLAREQLEIPKVAWRVNSSVSGGGLFHDLAPHQLDLMYYFFGAVEKVRGIATNQAGLYNADDIVSGNILFKSGVVFTGMWCFNIAEEEEKDECEIFGSEGKLTFSFFENPNIGIIHKYGKREILPAEPLQHVQQPLIEKIAEYFLDNGPNPCSAEDGAMIMHLIDQFTMK